MAKRFIDSEIWKKSWFRELKPKYKCFFVYLFTDCNNAGIWEKDIGTAEHFIGAKLELNKVLDIFESHIVELETNKWFLVDFIEFQYNCTLDELNPKNKAHLSVINKLNKYNISNITKLLVSPFEGAKDKDKDIDKDMDKVKDKDKEFFVESSIEFQLSQLLLDLIIKRDPNYKKPNLQEWSKHIDYLIRLDKRVPKNIKEVITWCQEDDFWQNNILSTQKLRKQFNQLNLKLKKSEEYI